MSSTLEIDSIILEYGLRRILQDVYLKIETGKITGLLGRNSSGKSSLMKILFGELNPSGKSIRINKSPILGVRRNPKEMKYLPQKNFIPQSLTIKQIFRDFDLDFQDFVNQFMTFRGHYDKRLKELSSGERRVIEVYSILCSETQFCILDEPFSMLMPIHINIFKKIMTKQKAHKGIIITDHMYTHVLEVCDNLYVLKEGKTHVAKGADNLKRLGYIES